MIKENFDNNGYDYVDLRLPSGTLWATMNVGASNPLDCGLYFQWGDTKGYTKDQIGEDKRFDRHSYKWYDDDKNVFTKYTTASGKLDLEDDAAHVNMGGDWHMPTPEQIQELIDNTTREFVILNADISYMALRSKNDASKYIFFPAAGYTSRDSVYDSGNCGGVWTSFMSKLNRGIVQSVCFNSDDFSLNINYRYIGRSVRGVIDKKIDDSKDKKNNTAINDKLNLVEILKDVPEGTELWSYACGTCYLEKIVRYSDYPISCKTQTKNSAFQSISFTKEGKRDVIYPNGKCVLFPSKDNQDWASFKAQKVKHFDPFQKVLHVDNNNTCKKVWIADFYSHYNKDENRHYLASGFIGNNDEIIPYKGNEDKLGKEAIE